MRETLPDITKRIYRPVGVEAYFALTAIGLISAALCGTALSWDGAAYLFNALDQQRPFTPNNRLINWPLHLPVILASHFTNSLTFLQVIFGMTYAAIPLLMLALCWWIVRDTARPLFIWAALGLGIGLLPGRINFVSEASLAVQFAWPLMLVIITGLRRKHLLIAVVMIVGLYVSHPLSLVFLLLAAAVAMLRGWRNLDERRWLWAWSAALLALTVTGAISFFLFRSSYERQQSSLGELGQTFASTLAGFPILGLGLAAIAALVLLATPLVGGRGTALERLMLGVATLCLFGTTIMFVLWAVDVSRWRLALLYSRWTVFVALVFLLPAIIEGVSYGVVLRDRLASTWRGRARIVQVIAAASSIVLIVQSFAWLNLNERLRDTVATSPWTCISAGTLSWLPGTPLDHWSLAQRVVLQQGRNPQQIMLDGNGCGETDFTAGLPLDPTIAPTVLRPWNRGWFNFAGVRDGLTAEMQGIAGCSYMLTSGWYQTEVNGKFWWRWSDGRAPQIRVVLDRAATVRLGGQFETAQAPNSIAIAVNRQLVTNVTLTARGQQPIDGLALPLKEGVNTIQLTSQNPATPYSVGSRQLAIAVNNLTVSVADSTLPCRFHP